MYQPDAVSNPYTPVYTTHYPNQYPVANAAVSTAIPYFPPYQGQQPSKPTPAPEILPPDPSEPSVTPAVASRAMERLVLTELKNAGFEKAAQPAVQRIEQELTTCMLSKQNPAN
jgi:transcription initiation factor TFIID subunit 8